MRIPAFWTAGDTVIWTDPTAFDSQGNQLGPDAWTLTYSLRGPTQLDISSTTTEGAWQFTATAADTAALTAGRYDWQCTATKTADGTKSTVGRGQIHVQPDLSAVATPYDGRSQVKQDLDAVQAERRARVAGTSAEEYAIAGRSVRKMAMKTLLELEARLTEAYAREVRSSRIKQGLGDPFERHVMFRASNSTWPNGNW